MIWTDLRQYHGQCPFVAALFGLVVGSLLSFGLLPLVIGVVAFIVGIFAGIPNALPVFYVATVLSIVAAIVVAFTTGYSTAAWTSVCFGIP
jgi:hypothetical protein